jgi:lipoyl synthase
MTAGQGTRAREHQGEILVSHLGLVPYRDAVALQERIRARRRAEQLPDTLLLLEHPPVYTRGRRSRPGELCRGEDFYRARGIEIVPTDRGGRVTYHGPGQLVGYPIMHTIDVGAHLRAMEAAIIATLADFGIEARSRCSEGPDYTGVWVQERKIASIGVHLSQGITTHGFAVNVDNDLDPFDWVIACGLPEVRMTSIARELAPGDAPSLDEFRHAIARRFSEVHRLRLRRVPADEIEEAAAEARAGAGASAVARAAAGTGTATGAGGTAIATRSRANPGGSNVLAVLGPDVRPLRERKPPWFKVPPPGGERYRELTEMIRAENLHTVCQEAACPNVGECWERGTATFMILGDTCTRRCGFCNVKTGKPTWNDPLEPARVARSIARMGLRHAVITSVDRDDLPDKGAAAFVGVIRQVRRQAPGCRVEVLTPDFQGQEMPLAKVIAECPDVFNHNVEVVPRLYPLARRGSQFERSCRVLRLAYELGEGEIVTKSGLMVGLGETHEEMLDTFAALRENHVQVLTVGQYLRPSERHLPVVRYWHPDEFTALEQAACELGFEHVAAGPLVRSSYHADQHVPVRAAS